MDTKYKQYTASIEPISDRKMAFTISTASVDRDGDTIDPKGWDLGSYSKNPVVLWAHDYSQPPIGKAANIKSTASGLQAEVEFLPKGVSPFADMIHEMCKGGFLNATSVGFRGMEYDEAKDRKGLDFKKQELLEFSIVPVPANPEALALRGVKSIQVKQYAKEMQAWATSVIGEKSPKMTQEQFDSLSGELAKILREVPEEKSADRKTSVMITPPEIDMDVLAEEVAKILKAGMQDVSNEVIDIEKEPDEIEWDTIEWKKEDEGVDTQYISDLLIDGMRKTFREMAGAQARAAVNKLTGRLD